MGCSCATPTGKHRPICLSAFFLPLGRNSELRCRRPVRCRFEPRSPVLLGWFVQNGLQKRIEAPEGYLSVPPVIGSVTEDVQQLLTSFLVELGIRRDLLEHDDKTGLRAR